MAFDVFIKTGGGQSATPVNLKVTFVIGRDTPPMIYSVFSGDFTIKTEMSGGIDIEIASPDRYRHSLELLFSKNTVEARQKLHDAYDPAIIALTAKPEMVFESGKVKIEAPIATEANLGPYTIEVHGTPMQMSGFLKPPTISGTLEMGRRKYKYTADIELRADVIRNQRPKGSPEPVQKVERQENPGIGWGQFYRKGHHCHRTGACMYNKIARMDYRTNGQNFNAANL